jgi:MFS transporter, DHA1 family, multidrug resistance protein
MRYRRGVPNDESAPAASNWRRVLAVLFTSQLLTAIGFSTIFPFLPRYVEHLGSATGAPNLLLVTLVFSVQALAMMLAAPVWGTLGDRFGRKRMVERAMYSGAVTILLMGFAGSAEQLVGLRLLQGLTTGVMGASGALVAASVPRERLGYAMGLLQTGLLSGASVGPMIGGVLEYAFGYRAAFMVTATLLLVGALLVSTLVHEHFVAPERDARTAGVSGFFRMLGAVMRTPVVAQVFAVRFLAWTGRSMIIPFLPLLVASLMADAARAGLVTGLAIGLSSAAGTVTSVVLGRLGDRVGHRRVALVCAALTVVAYLPLAFVRSPAALVALYALTGATVGGVLPTLAALLARITERGSSGTVYGLDNAVGAGARGLSPIIGGAVVALAAGTALEPDAGAYASVFLAAGACFVAALALLALLVPTRVDPLRGAPR